MRFHQGSAHVFLGDSGPGDVTQSPEQPWKIHVLMIVNPRLRRGEDRTPEAIFNVA